MKHGNYILWYNGEICVTVNGLWAAMVRLSSQILVTQLWTVMKRMHVGRCILWPLYVLGNNFPFNYRYFGLQLSRLSWVKQTGRFSQGFPCILPHMFLVSTEKSAMIFKTLSTQLSSMAIFSMLDRTETWRGGRNTPLVIPISLKPNALEMTALFVTMTSSGQGVYNMLI